MTRNDPRGGHRDVDRVADPPVDAAGSPSTAAPDGGASSGSRQARGRGHHDGSSNRRFDPKELQGSDRKRSTSGERVRTCCADACWPIVSKLPACDRRMVISLSFSLPPLRATLLGYMILLSGSTNWLFFVLQSSQRSYIQIMILNTSTAGSCTSIIPGIMHSRYSKTKLLYIIIVHTAVIGAFTTVKPSTALWYLYYCIWYSSSVQQ